MIHSGTEAETRLVLALLHLNHRVSVHEQSAAAGRMFYFSCWWVERSDAVAQILGTWIWSCDRLRTGEGLLTTVIRGLGSVDG